jgi:hypothetical protein
MSKNEMTPEERSNAYMNKEEYRMTRLDALQIIQKSNYGLLTDQDGEDPLRGLEMYTREFKNTVSGRRRLAIHDVIIKQSQCTDEWIAMNYRETTKEASQIAYGRGLSDQVKAWGNETTACDDKRSALAPPSPIVMFR